MSLFLSIALAIFSYNFMIDYGAISKGVALPAAWVIFFLSLWLSDNIKPMKILNQNLKKSDERIKALENKVDDLNNQLNTIQTRLNHTQNIHQEKEMEAEIDFFKKNKK